MYDEKIYLFGIHVTRGLSTKMNATDTKTLLAIYVVNTICNTNSPIDLFKALSVPIQKSIWYVSIGPKGQALGLIKANSENCLLRS